jgi:hypothetical protein
MTFSTDTFTLNGSETLGEYLSNHKSSEDGSTWTYVNQNQPYVNNIVLNPNSSVYGIGSGAIYINSNASITNYYDVNVSVTYLSQPPNNCLYGAIAFYNSNVGPYQLSINGNIVTILSGNNTSSIFYPSNGSAFSTGTAYFSPTVGRTYNTQLSIRPYGESGRIILGTISGGDLSNPITIIATDTTTASSPGSAGIQIFNVVGSPTTNVHLSNYSAAYYSSPTFLLNSTTVTENLPTIITVSGKGTSWTDEIVFSVSGGTGASISNIGINTTTQIAYFTLNPGTSTGVLTISNNTDSSTQTIHVKTLAQNTSSVTPNYNVQGSFYGNNNNQLFSIGY